MSRYFIKDNEVHELSSFTDEDDEEYSKENIIQEFNARHGGGASGKLSDELLFHILSGSFDEEYSKEDVIQELDTRYGEGASDKLSDELLSNIIEEYNDKRGDSDEWHSYVDAAIETFASEISKELDTDKEIE